MTVSTTIPYTLTRLGAILAAPAAALYIAFQSRFTFTDLDSTAKG